MEFLSHTISSELKGEKKNLCQVGFQNTVLNQLSVLLRLAEFCQRISFHWWSLESVFWCVLQRQGYSGVLGLVVHMSMSFCRKMVSCGSVLLLRTGVQCLVLLQNSYLTSEKALNFFECHHLTWETHPSWLVGIISICLTQATETLMGHRDKAVWVLC